MSYIKDYIKMTSVRYLSSHDFPVAGHIFHVSCMLCPMLYTTFAI